MIKRVEIPRLYDRPQPPCHTLYVLLDLHVRVLRVRIEDCHEDLILGRGRCFGALRHGQLLMLSDVNLIKAGSGIPAVLRMVRVKACIAVRGHRSRVEGNTRDDCGRWEEKEGEWRFVEISTSSLCRFLRTATVLSGTFQAVVFT